jgi:hypothetical protein
MGVVFALKKSSRVEQERQFTHRESEPNTVRSRIM